MTLYMYDVKFTKPVRQHERKQPNIISKAISGLNCIPLSLEKYVLNITITLF